MDLLIRVWFGILNDGIPKFRVKQINAANFWVIYLILSPI